MNFRLIYHLELDFSLIWMIFNQSISLALLV